MREKQDLVQQLVERMENDGPMDARSVERINGLLEKYVSLDNTSTGSVMMYSPDT